MDAWMDAWMALVYRRLEEEEEEEEEDLEAAWVSAALMAREMARASCWSEGSHGLRPYDCMNSAGPPQPEVSSAEDNRDESSLSHSTEAAYPFSDIL